jgi:hypothetical protein
MKLLDFLLVEAAWFAKRAQESHELDAVQACAELADDLARWAEMVEHLNKWGLADE